MKILVISDVPWNEENSVGNTYNNIFKSMKNTEFANLYCKPGKPDSKLPTQYYQMTEKDIIRNLIVKKKSKDKNLYDTERKSSTVLNKKEQKIYDVFRSIRLQSFFIAREFIWKVGRWKTKELKYFLQDFKPDIIFSFCLDSIYYANIIDYCRRVTDAELVLFFADDVYMYKKRNPLYIVHQHFIRKKIKNLSYKCKLMYGATHKLCDEYSKILNTKLFPLYKICNELSEIKTVFNKPLQLTYTGNLFYGRWRVLALLSQAIKEINGDSVKLFLNIYTSGLYNEKIETVLNVDGASRLVGGIPYEEVKKVLRESDIVVHVESFEDREIKKTRLSFSTKIVDCIQSGSCLLAIGPNEVASISLLKEFNIAQVISDNTKKYIKDSLIAMLEDNRIMYETCVRMREYGLRNHSLDFLKINLYDKLEKLSKGDH